MQQIKLTESLTWAKAYLAKPGYARAIFPSLLSHRYLFGVLWLAVLLIITACGATEPPQDIALEAQAVATATPAPVEEAAPTDSASDELSTEIIEPVSPLSPVATPEIADSAANAVEEMVKSMEIIPGSEKAVAAAIADLIQQAGVAPEAITLVSIEAQEWPDASLGCPQEDYMYAQVITPGYKVILEADGTQYNYHTNSESTVVLCQE